MSIQCRMTAHIALREPRAGLASRGRLTVSAGHAGIRQTALTVQVRKNRIISCRFDRVSHTRDPLCVIVGDTFSRSNRLGSHRHHK
eukprot:9492793-Pyramimonas_sp.AAC.1